MFIVNLKFDQNKSNAAAFADDHEFWLEQGFKEGVFVLAGSLVPGIGFCLLAHNTSRASLEERIMRDPFVEEKVVSYELTEFAPAQADDKLKHLIGWRRRM